MRHVFVCVITLTVALAEARSQIPDASLFAFEAASVKLNNSGSTDSGLSPNRGGGFVVNNLTLPRLIEAAYQLQRFQLQGGPAWLQTDRFDIVARYRSDVPAVPPGAPAAWMLALRALFAERFKLVMHTETRQVPIYALTVARQDGKLGPALRPATTDCVARAAADAAAVRAGGPPPPPVNTEARMACGIRNTGSRILFGGNPMSLFVQGLSNLLRRPVVDRTSLAGNWDFELGFTPEQQRAAPTADAGIDAGPSIFTAIQEQLGLKLEATTGPVDVMVIDGVERPAAD